MRETWFVMEDGSLGDPSDVALDGKGVLRHKDGRAVAMRGDVPRSRGVDVEAKDMRPAQSGPAYLTRETAPKVEANELYGRPTALFVGGQATLGGDDTAALRAEYQKAFGKRPYLGWDAATLREKIASKAE